jgi:hypothetical protein
VAVQKIDEAKLEAELREWLEQGGEQQLERAMARARETSDDFARSTRVRTETLYEPVAF